MTPSSAVSLTITKLKVSTSVFKASALFSVTASWHIPEDQLMFCAQTSCFCHYGEKNILVWLFQGMLSVAAKTLQCLAQPRAFPNNQPSVWKLKSNQEGQVHVCMCWRVPLLYQHFLGVWSVLVNFIRTVIPQCMFHSWYTCPKSNAWRFSFVDKAQGQQTNLQCLVVYKNQTWGMFLILQIQSLFHISSVPLQSSVS